MTCDRSILRGDKLDVPKYQAMLRRHKGEKRWDEDGYHYWQMVPGHAYGKMKIKNKKAHTHVRAYKTR
jgi:hypothetical protein